MTVAARERLAEILGGVEGWGAFSARRTMPVDDLSIEVRDVGPLRFPVPQAQAKQLVAVARPARYGRGERTLLDRRVRDTWEVPLSRVTLDKRRWHRVLRAVLDQLRGDLGVLDGCELKTELRTAEGRYAWGRTSRSTKRMSSSAALSEMRRDGPTLQRC